MRLKEELRVNAVERYKELELKQDKNLQEIVQLASYIFQTPVSLLTLVDKDMQWVISKKGTDAEAFPVEASFCKYAIEQDLPMVVPNAMEDQRFADIPVVKTDPNIKFYAGVPLKSNEGHNVGTLCVLDVKPQAATQEQLDCLQALTNQVANLLELKLAFKALSASFEEVSEQKTLLEKIAQVQSHELRAPVASIMGIMNVIKYDNYKADEQLLITMEKVVKQLDTKVRSIVSLASNNNDGFNKIGFPVHLKNPAKKLVNF